jgi:hypothetical protein
MLDERQTALADAVVAQRIARRRRRSPARRLRWALHGTLTRLGRCVDAVKHKIPMRAAQQQGLKMERSDFWEARRDHCRETALALRRLARRAYFPSIRRELIDFANRYDQMAKRCEWHWHSETVEQQIERENAMMADRSSGRFVRILDKKIGEGEVARRAASRGQWPPAR